MEAVRLLLFTNLFVALGAAAATWASYLRLGGREPRSGLLLFAFVGLATLLVYNLDRVGGRAPEDRVRPSERHRWILAHRGLLLAIGLLAGLGAGAVALLLPWRDWVALTPLGILSLAYVVPLVPGAAPRLKELSVAKIFVIAGVWAAATVVLPGAHAGASARAVAWLSLERFLFVLAICLPFDVRDLERDAEAGIRTLPMILGLGGTRALAGLLLAAHALLLALEPAVLGVSSDFAQVTALTPLLLVDAVTLAVVLPMSPGRGDLYTSLLVDGTLLLAPLLIALGP